MAQSLLLDKSLRRVSRLNWEKALFIAIIVLALITRFWDLGYRVQSHDESIHTKYSWHLYSGEGFSHHPLMHGPFLFHATALSYFLFGVNDFTARVPVALIGVAVVAFPYLLRRWMGRKGALAASFFLLISPSIAYYSRYIRHDLPVMLWSLITILAVFCYLRDGRRRWLFLMGGSVSLMFATKEVAFIYNAIFGLFLAGLFVFQALRREWPRERLKSWFLLALVGVAVGVLVFGGTTLFRLEELRRLEDPPPLSPEEVPVFSLWDAAQDVSAVVMVLLIIFSLVLLVIGNLRREGVSMGPKREDALGGNGLDEIDSLKASLGNALGSLERVIKIPWPVVSLALLVVALGVVLRIGLPMAVSFSSCPSYPAGQAPAGYDRAACVQQALDMFQWPQGGTRILTWLTGDGILLDTQFVLSVLPFIAGALVVLSWFIVRAFRGSRSFDLAILLGTLCLPLLSPLPMGLAGLKPMDYTAPVIYYTGAIAIEMFLLSLAIGLVWDLQRRIEGRASYDWLITAAVYYVIFVLLFTTILTNAYGIASGTVGSLGYWLEQQEVERGSQPMYYYGVMVAFYEYLPFLLTCAAVVYLAIREGLLTHLIPSVRSLGKTPAFREYFLPFVLWWVALSWAGYSVAGERMPWLTVHIALPMILLAGWLVGRLLQGVDWQEVRRGQAWLLLLVAPLFVVSMGVLTKAIAARPFQGTDIGQLQATGWLANGLIGVLATGLGLSYLLWRSEWRSSVRMLLIAAIMLPVLLTIRTAWRFCYVNFDDANEFLVYAHAAPGVRTAMEQIDEIARRLGGKDAVKVAYGSDASTMFHWQLRDYPTNYYGDHPSKETLDVPVIIAGQAQQTAVEPYIGDGYVTYTYAYIWWPMQDYFNVQDEKSPFFELDLQELSKVLGDPEMRAALWDIWYDRDYGRYDEITGRTHALDKWPLRQNFYLYIRRDLARQLWDLGTDLPVEEGGGEPPADVYAVGFQADVAPRQVFGAGWLLNPRGVKIGPDGSVYVADTGQRRVYKFTADGELIETFEAGFGDNSPWDVAVATDGSLYVADTWNHRIQMLDAAGNWAGAWGVAGAYGPGDPAGQSVFFGPRGIAIGPGGRIYVTDTGNKRVQVFEPDGTFTFQWGGGGVLPGYLDEPVGIAIGPDGNVYVADVWNRRIQVFDETGIFLFQWPIAEWQEIGVSERYPYLAIDNDGYVYITDPLHFRVLVFDSSGTYVLSFGQYGVEESSFRQPNGIAVAEDGSVYVSDAQNGRVLVFDPLEMQGGVAAPTLKFPQADAELPPGPLTLVGTGEPGGQVRVLVDDRIVGSAPVDDDGLWVLLTELTEPGEHEIVLQALAMQERTGVRVVATSAPIRLIVLKIESDVSVPELDPELAEGGLPAGELTLSGTGEPSSIVRVLVDGQSIGIALVDSRGDWSILATIYEPGEHEVIVQALDVDGQVIVSSEPLSVHIILLIP